MKFDSTVTLGAVFQILTMVALVIAAYYAIKGHLALFEQTLEAHTRALSIHTDRMDRTEARLAEFVADLQRLIGRVETTDGINFVHRRRDS